MKAIPVVICVAVLAVFALAGCGDGKDAPNGTGDAAMSDLAKAVENAHFENAPTLGALGKEATLHILANEWSDLWAMLDKANREQVKKEMAAEKASLATIDQQIADVKAKIASATVPFVRKAYEAQLAALTRKKEKLPGVNSVEDYFVYMATTPNKQIRDIFEELFLKDKAEVVREEIASDGSTGKIIIKIPGSNKQVTAYQFTKEDGAWKLALAKTLDEQAGDAGGATDGGGHEGTLDEQLAAAFGKMNLEKAPVLGETFRTFYTAVAKADWGALWDNMNAADRASIENAMKHEQAAVGAKIEDLKRQAASATTPEEKARLQKEIDAAVNALSDRNRELLAIPDAKAYFAFKMRDVLHQMLLKARQELLQDGLAVVGEEVSADGNSGRVAVSNVKSGAVSKVGDFVKEVGGWRYKLVNAP
jgi:hypothetical protein